MGMSKTLLPPIEEVEQRNQPELSSSVSLEDAIDEYIRIQTRQMQLTEEKKRVLELLIPAALEARQGAKTARIANHNNSVVLKAEFHEGYRCDTNGLNQVREILGDDVFEDYFKVEYKPKLRALRTFLATRSTDERAETAKEEIKKHVTSYEESPRFTVEKGSPPMPWE